VENLTGKSISLHVGHNVCGRSFQELVELQGVPGRNYAGALDYFQFVPQAERRMERNRSTGEFIYTYSLDRIGEYSITLITQWLKPSATFWLCGPLEVTEGPVPIPPTATPELTSCEEVEETCLELTFDGESCTYAGPTDFGEGLVTLLFINASELHAAVNMLRHAQGKTIEDMRAYFGGETSTKHAPSWTEDYGTWTGIAPGMIQVWRGELRPGIHTVVCASFCPWLVWFGGGFAVGE
jgi:hypothetical protein